MSLFTLATFAHSQRFKLEILNDQNIFQPIFSFNLLCRIFLSRAKICTGNNKGRFFDRLKILNRTQALQKINAGRAQEVFADEALLEDDTTSCLFYAPFGLYILLSILMLLLTIFLASKFLYKIIFIERLFKRKY